MKRAVGIHFGHDAGIAVISENGIERFLSKERLSKFKHASGWDAETVSAVLATTPGAVVGLSVTQGGGDGRGLGVVVKTTADFSISSSSKRFQSGKRKLDFAFGVQPLLRWAKDDGRSDHFMFSISDDWHPTLEKRSHLRYTAGLRALGAGGYNPNDLPQFFDFHNNPEIGTDPCAVHANGATFDGRFFMHHLAHAYYGFWASGLETALVISHDGGHTSTWDGGGYFWCSRQHGVLPLTPGGFWMGFFYGKIGVEMGLDAGKLMGLAPYGTPKFFMEQFVGNIGDVESVLGYEHLSLVSLYLNSVAGAALPTLSKWDHYGDKPPQLLADIAASAQKICETSVLSNVETGLSLVKALGKQIEGVILVGGVALNCPANTKVHQKFGLKVVVPPACNDEGLAIGNAVGAYFKAYGHFPPAPSDDYAKVYLGDEYSDADIAAATRGLEKLSDFSADTAASLIADGAIVGIFYGRSEIGPRALGHRSILASPLLGSNWKKVNAVKDREAWRPFAPICLEEDMSEHFADSDMKSRYMLFTHRVKHDRLPAITHLDGSARAQAATPACGPVYDILKAFKAKTGYGVLMNTSFNGKAVPIVETPADAVAEAKRIGLDYLICTLGIFRTKP